MSIIWRNYLLRTILILNALAGQALALGSNPEVEDPLEISAFLKPTKLESHQIALLELRLRLPEQYKAYEDQFALELVSPDGFKLTKPTVSPVQKFFDEFSKKERTGMQGEAVMRATLEAPAKIPSSGTLKLKLTYQACTKTYCLFPTFREVTVGFQSASASTNAIVQIDGGFLSQKLSQAMERGVFWTFLFVFVAGLLTSLTPCVFPMIPITLAVLGKNSHLRSRWQSVIVSHAYVLGIAMTYALLGLLAASTGKLFGNFMSSPVVLAFICVVFLAMALSMLGAYEIEAPPRVQNFLDRFTHYHGPVGAFATGVVSGIVASPCVGPVLVAILTYVAQTQDLWFGFWLLFVFALGMGQLFLALGLSTHLTKKLPRSGPWLVVVKKAFGVLMLGVFIYYASLLYASLESSESKSQKIAAKDAFPGQGLVWEPLTEQALAQAASEGKPVIIDFWAEWCGACHELDKVTYTHQRVQLMASQFALFKFDATSESPELEKFRQQFKIVGLPWVVFLDRKGKWIEDLTLAGFEDPEPFVERLTKALKSDKPSSGP